MNRPTEIQVTLYDPRGREGDFWEAFLEVLFIGYDVEIAAVEVEEV